MQAFTRLTSLKKLRLDSCGQLRCHPDVSGGLMRQLDDISLRQCRLGNLGCLDIFLGLRTLRVIALSPCPEMTVRLHGFASACNLVSCVHSQLLPGILAVCATSASTCTWPVYIASESSSVLCRWQAISQVATPGLCTMLGRLCGLSATTSLDTRRTLAKHRPPQECVDP